MTLAENRRPRPQPFYRHRLALGETQMFETEVFDFTTPFQAVTSILERAPDKWPSIFVDVYGNLPEDIVHSSVFRWVMESMVGNYFNRDLFQPALTFVSATGGQQQQQQQPHSQDRGLRSDRGGRNTDGSMGRHDDRQQHSQQQSRGRSVSRAATLTPAWMLNPALQGPNARVRDERVEEWAVRLGCPSHACPYMFLKGVCEPKGGSSCGFTGPTSHVQRFTGAPRPSSTAAAQQLVASDRGSNRGRSVQRTEVSSSSSGGSGLRPRAPTPAAGGGPHAHTSTPERSSASQQTSSGAAQPPRGDVRGDRQAPVNSLGMAAPQWQRQQSGGRPRGGFSNRAVTASPEELESVLQAQRAKASNLAEMSLDTPLKLIHFGPHGDKRVTYRVCVSINSGYPTDAIIDSGANDNCRIAISTPLRLSESATRTMLRG